MRGPRPPLLLVGLGNPGPEYERTRHNAGARTLLKLAALLSAKFASSPAHLARVARVPGAVLALPSTFMNDSGQSVRRLAAFFGTPLLVADDLDQPAGALRFRTRGGSGGHNGLKSVIAELGHDRFPRLKIGVGHPGARPAVVDWVLTEPEPADAALIAAAEDRAAGALRQAMRLGLERAMTELHA